ncbi:MAG TPA: DUF6600 domain-containing protein [Chitinophagaceae bacterium]|nr:DUF6600 domain-containing protein [Chitinophagaceae bacterium]
MKHLIYATIIAGATVLFSCNSSPNTNNAGNTDSTMAGDSSMVSQPDGVSSAEPQASIQDNSSSSSEAVAAAPAQEDEAAAAAPEVTYQKFYDELSPYGKWIDYPSEGYVWQPSVEAGFQPYSTNGHWVYTNDGWTWNSDYKWGWAAFHYGRWFHQDKYGWLWKPGNEWGPAWVKWGQSGDNYGWAPLGLNVSVSASWNPPPATWNFVPKRYIDRTDVDHYVVDRKQNVTIAKNVTIINNITKVNNTTIINRSSNNKTVINNKKVNNNKTVVNNNVSVRGNNNVVYNKGPQVKDVENVTKTKVKEINIANDNRPNSPKIQNNKLVLYRPNVKLDTKKNARPFNIQRNDNHDNNKKVVAKRPQPKNDKKNKH